MSASSEETRPPKARTRTRFAGSNVQQRPRPHTSPRVVSLYEVRSRGTEETLYGPDTYAACERWRDGR